MKKSINLLMKTLIALPLLALIGCATHSSPRQLPTGEKFLFVSDNEMAFFAAAYDAMNEARPRLPIFDFDGPGRGYQMTRVVVLYRYTTVIRVNRAEGEDADGNTISGYYPEVSGIGTMIMSGPATDHKVYRLALEKFGVIGTRKPVNELRSISFANEDAAPPRSQPVAIVTTYDIATANWDDVSASLLRDGRVALRGINFATDSADLSGGSYAAAGNIGEVLNGHPQLNLAVVGHTDNTGDFTYNIELSQRRAQAIVDALVNDYDVELTRLAAVGVGPLAPIDTNRTEYGRGQNRRVELVLIE
jgi:outer membrane protein OmpA-like peptidoglycan-associated protein